MTDFLLKISSDSQSFHFMVYERSDILERFSFKTVGKKISFQKKNAILYILSFFILFFFFTNSLCGTVYKEKEEQFKLNLVKNNGSFKYKMQKSDLKISKTWKALHMDEWQVRRTPSWVCSSMDKYWLSTSYWAHCWLSTLFLALRHNNESTVNLLKCTC